MFQPANAWMYARPGARLGQFAPFVGPDLAPVRTPGAAAPAGNGAAIVLVAGLGLLGLAASAVGVLFHYGIARESKSGLVKTTGYILAGAGVLGTLITVGGIIGGAAAATR
jgi:hypothetical protein